MGKPEIRMGGRRGQAALLLLSLAMLMRFLVPAGWMPVATTSGGWTITPCSGSGPMRMSMAGARPAAMTGMHHGPGQQDHGSADHPCVYSSLALALDAPPLPVLDLPRLVVATWLASIGSAVSIGRGLAAPPPPSTGPPQA